MNILIVEDSAPVRRMICGLLSAFAERFFECETDSEAVALYRAHRPCWVLMDIVLSQGDGIAATQKICADDPQARVVIVTNYGDDDLQEAAANAGACGFIVKEDLYTLPAYLAGGCQRDGRIDRSEIHSRAVSDIRK